MQISQQRLAYLLDAYSNGRASEDEVNELLDWARASNDPKPLNDFVQQLIDQYDPNEPTQHVDWEALYERIQRERGPAGISDASLNTRQLPVERLPIRRISWFRATAAAAILLIATTIVLYRYNKPAGTHQVATKPTTKPATPATPDIQPGADGAILTLANGQKIVLDSAGNGTLATQGNTSLHNEHGQLSYNSTNAQPTGAQQTDAQQNEVLYNTITTTRGKQYQLRLADGSKVWLNASSSLKFPTAFTGDSRTVEVTGEAYFEVAPDASKPFKVHLRDSKEILVLGTNFNVNAYEDEGAIRTTLVDGSVKIMGRLLHPGEQAQVGQNSINVTEKINIDEIVAWKEGLFLMKKADVASIMRQIARWYDVEVVYKGNIPSGRISGDIPRNMALSKVLEVMELSGIHFKVEGKKVIVSPG